MPSRLLEVVSVAGLVILFGIGLQVRTLTIAVRTLTMAVRENTLQARLTVEASDRAQASSAVVATYVRELREAATALVAAEKRGRPSSSGARPAVARRGSQPDADELEPTSARWPPK